MEELERRSVRVYGKREKIKRQMSNGLCEACAQAQLASDKIV